MCFSFTTIFHPQHPYSLRKSLRKLFVFCINACECVRMSVYTLVLYKQLKQFKAIQHANYFIKALDYWYYQNITFKQRFNSSPVFFSALRILWILFIHATEMFKIYSMLLSYATMSLLPWILEMVEKKRISNGDIFQNHPMNMKTT